jgi:hypothetical protein
MNYDVKVIRTMRGEIEARTLIDLGFNSLQLRVTTMKRSRGMSTNASVVHMKEDGCYTHMVFSDFSETLAAESGRATMAAIERLHRLALEQRLPAALEKVRAQYAIPAATEAVPA